MNAKLAEGLREFVEYQKPQTNFCENCHFYTLRDDQYEERAWNSFCTFFDKSGLFGKDGSFQVDSRGSCKNYRQKEAGK